MAHRYFTLFILNFNLVFGQAPLYVLKETEVTLSPALSEAPEDILWKHNGDKVIEFNGMEEKVYGQYENRVTLSWHSADLSIADVQYEDGGGYELDAFIRGRLHRSQYRLKVLDKVAQPTISCEMTDESSFNMSGHQATLMCSADSAQPESLKFEWRSYGNVRPGQTLTISLGDKHDDEEHSCTVSNPLHAASAAFTAKDCYSEENSSALTVGIVVPCVLVLVLVLVILFFFHKRLCKACTGGGGSDDVEKQKKQSSVTDETATPDEQRRLVYRQSTLPSKQQLRNLPQTHQNDSDQDSRKVNDDLDVIRNQELVKKKRMFFETSGLNTRLLRDAQTEKDTEKEEEGVSPPAVPSILSPVHQDVNVDEDKDPRLENSDPESAEKSHSAGDLVNSLRDLQSDLQSSEQPDLEKEAETDEESVSPPALLNILSSVHQDLNVDEDKLPQVENSHLESAEKLDPAGDLVNSLEDAQSDVQPPTASEEQPGPEKKKDEKEEAKPLPPSGVSPPTASPCSPLSNNAQIKETKDTDDERKDDSDSDEVSVETKEKNIRESDSSGAGEMNESDESSEEKQSTVSDQKGSEILSQEETAKEKPSLVENESDSEGELNKEQNPSSDSTRADPDLDQEGSSGRRESKGQSDSGTEKEDKSEDKGEAVEEKNDVHCDSTEEEPTNDRLSQDEKEQKGEAVS